MLLAFSLASVPLWAWIAILVVAAAIVTPIKMKVFRKLLNRSTVKAPDED